MKDSVKAVTQVKFKCDDYLFSSSGSVIKYEGFRRVYMVSSDNAEEQSQTLPLLKEGDMVDIKNAEAKGHTTTPPQRYSEASLVQKLESEEIGRPSTYSPTITTILERR